MSLNLYQIEHETTFIYKDEIAESVMEVRLQPRQDSNQRLHWFQLNVQPHAATHHYMDYMGNVIHHFNIPDLVKELSVISRSVVELFPGRVEADYIGKTSWKTLESICANPTDEIWDTMQPSVFIKQTELLKAFVASNGIEKKETPFETALYVNQLIFNSLTYLPNSTKVDSPIDDALSMKAGVCQDFTHVMLSVLRALNMPARYVSGYVFPRESTADRGDGATHAWVEVFFPEFGWVGFDPTNNLMTGIRHIRVATGRDYADVPPTRGLYRGGETSELVVKVAVKKIDHFAEEAYQELRQAPPQKIKRSFKHLEHDYRQQQQQQQQVNR